MNVYPESLFTKLFTCLEISNHLTRENIKAINDRATLLYTSSVLLPYLIAGIALVILIVLCKKWKTPHSLPLFSGILFLGGFSIWNYVVGSIIEGITNFIPYLVSLRSISFHLLTLTYIPMMAFPLVIYFLSRYAYAHKGKIAPLGYVSVGLQSLISLSVNFWELNLLAKMQYDKINDKVYFEIKPYSMVHLLTALACYLSLIALFYLLWKPLRKVAESHGILIAKMYTNLSVMVTVFLIIWLGITTYIHTYIIKDIVPLWMHYGSVITPHLFYAFFTVYFMYVLRRINR